MRVPLAAAAALLTLAARPVAGAEPSGPVIGLRLGIASAIGSAVDDVSVAEAASYQYPIQLEMLWSIGRAAVGASVSWGLARSTACQGSCASVTRTGLEATWRFGQWRDAESWAGIAAGYEWATEDEKSGGGDVMRFWRGFQLFGAQGGLEWHVASALAIGPFLSLGIGRYTHLAVETVSESASADLSRRALHAWVDVGARVRFVPGAIR